MVIEGRFADTFLDPKKVFNRGIGAFALVFCTPLLIGVAVAVKFSIGGAVFVVEPRQRDGNDPYMSRRFRTSHGEKHSSFGRFLQLSRLECLPRLVNVVRGDISIAAVLD